jgi:hypothetical protein
VSIVHPSSEILGQYLDKAIAVSFQILSSHPIYNSTLNNLTTSINVVRKIIFPPRK